MSDESSKWNRTDEKNFRNFPKYNALCILGKFGGSKFELNK